MQSARLPDMPAPPDLDYCRSDQVQEYADDLSVWFDTCRKIIAKNPNVTPPPMPARSDFGARTSDHDRIYRHARGTWEGIWD